MTSLYIVGSLRNPEIPKIAARIRRATSLDVFDDWYAVGPEADEYWQRYEIERGHDYRTSLKGWHAEDVFRFDKTHLDRCDAALLVMPAGRSAHLELGYVVGSGKPGYILMDKEPERYDIMYQFATKIFYSVEEVLAFL